MAVASFSLAPDAAVDLAWKLGLSLRWLAQDTNGGSSGMSMLGNALRTVETGAADVVLILGGDATGLAGYAKVAANYNTATQKHLSPLGHGGPNGVYALVASRQIKKYGLEKSDYGHIAIAQREWAAKNPHAVYRAPLTMDGVSRRAVGRRSAVALRLRAGGGGRAGDHRGAARPRAEGPAGRARPRASRAATTTTTRRATGLQTGISTFADELWREAGVRPDDIDVASDLRRLSDHGAGAGQRSRPHSRQRSGALLPRDHRRAAFPGEHLGRHAVGRPARRPRRRPERHFRSGAAIAASRRRAAGEGRAARGRHRLRHDDVPLRRHRGGGDPGARANERGRHHLALRELPHRIFSGAAAVPALSRRHVRRPIACTRPWSRRSPSSAT